MTLSVLPRFGAVSFLNSVPLVWGMMNGPQQGQVDLSFSVPSECASRFADGSLDAGLLPVAEIIRQGLQIVPGVGISCLGPVRSILLFSKVPWPAIQTLAADSSSRTSVELARVILRERFGVRPFVQTYKPDLDTMLQGADAALIIGDPALYLDPAKPACEVLDLGSEWLSLTGLPMVFAAWACRPDAQRADQYAEIAQLSYQYGRTHLDEIIQREALKRSLPLSLVDIYLRRHIRYPLLDQELKGLNEFVRLSGLHSRRAA